MLANPFQHGYDRFVIKIGLLSGILLFLVGCSQISTVAVDPTRAPTPSFALNLPPTVQPESAQEAPLMDQIPADLLDSILKDLAERTGAPPEKIEVVQAQVVIWNDGSLGCGKPGEFYTQALVDGYWVILEIEGETYDYRATDRGHFFLCEGSPRPTPPHGTPSS